MMGSGQRRRSVWWAVAVVLLGLLVGLLIWTVFRAPAPRATASPRVRVSLDFFPNPNHVPLYVALEKGLFEDEGLVVELFVPAHPSDPVKLAAARAVEIALTPQINYLIARAEDLPLVAIGALVGQPLGGLVALRGAGIAELADLRRAKVGYSLEPLEPVLWGTVFACAGVDPSSVVYVNVGYNAVSALIAGHVDAIGAFRNYELLQLEELGHDPIFFPQEEYCVPTTYELILVAHPSYMAQHAEVAAAFVRALARGVEWTIEYPEEASALFFRVFPDLDDALNRRSFEHTLPLYARNAYHADRGVWERLQAYLVEGGLVSHAIPVATLYTDEALPVP